MEDAPLYFNGAKSMNESSYEPVFVARQPIFDRNQDIWGYELLFRASGEARGADFDDPDMATAKVIADGYALAAEGVDSASRKLVNFPASLLLKDTPFALPRDSCVVEILETVKPTPEILDACRRLKEAGYTLALDDFVGDPGYEPLLELADIVKVDVLGMSKPELIRLTQSMRGINAELLAEKVEDREMFNVTKTLGYTYFQGYFFSRPVVVPGRKISSAAAKRLELLRELARPDADLQKLSSIISMDLSLSYRLLKFINSAAFALRHEVNSIDQAVTLLGLESLRQWLMVVVLSDIEPSPRAQELTLMSVRRARFLSRLGESGSDVPYSPETLFLLGLFSTLDALLDMPMEDILAEVPLKMDIKDALLGEENSAAELLGLVGAMDRGDFERAAALLSRFGVQEAQAAVDLQKASVWAKEVIEGSREDAGASDKVGT